MTLDFFELSDIQNDINRIDVIFATNIFSPENLKYHPLARSAFIDVIICLQDLLAKADKLKKRVAFKDDVIVNNPKAKHNDITDLVFFIRNAVCHIQSELHKVPETTKAKNIRASYNTVIGKGEVTMYGVTFKSDYDDDICFYFGEYYIYLIRHIVRAFEEVKPILVPLL